jgi:hypothetical protein
MSDGWEKAQRMYNADGYIVMWSHIPRKIGEIVRDASFMHSGGVDSVPQPFQIVAEASKQDYIRQLALIGEIPDSQADFVHFYKVVTE